MQLDPVTSATVPKIAYAAIRGCTPAYISKLIKQGKLRAPALTPEGRIDVSAANAMLGAPMPQLQPLTSYPARDADPGDDAEAYAASRAKREAANAEKAELELAELRARLVDKAEVDREVADLVSGLRDAILMVPREVADHCAGLEGPAIEGVMMLALKRVLTAQSVAAMEGRRDAA